MDIIDFDQLYNKYLYLLSTIIIGEPPSEITNISLTRNGSIIQLNWLEPNITHGGIQSYSVAVRANKIDGGIIYTHNETTIVSKSLKCRLINFGEPYFMPINDLFL